MSQTNHIKGLTDAEVIESRKKNGVNILTPPEKETLWDKFKETCQHWIAISMGGLLIASIVGAFVFQSAQVTNIWMMPLIVFIASILILVVGFLGGFGDPLFKILITAFVLSSGISIYEYECVGAQLSTFFEPLGIIAALLLATGVAFWLERNNEKTFQSLNEVNDDTLVKVVRNINVCQVPRKDIVVGDIVLLETGEEVPADCQLIESLNLIVNESSLTGELQASKTTEPEQFNQDSTYPSNHILKGTTIIDGYCTAQVIRVGDKTECGKVFEAAQVVDGDPTPLSKKLDDLADKITKWSYAFAIAIVVGRLLTFAYRHGNLNDSFYAFVGLSLIISFGVFYLLQKMKIDINSIEIEDENLAEEQEEKNGGLEIFQVLACLILPIIGVILYLCFGVETPINWIEFITYALNSVMIAVTLIVVAVPEGLPMSVTLSLAFSMRKLMKQNTLPRTMHACETMGATSVICTDKTGTLTKNLMQVSNANVADIDEHLIAEMISLNSTANLDCADEKSVKTIGNPTEGALLLWLRKNGINYLQIRENVKVVDRLPFSSVNKYMATIVQSEVLGCKVLYVKGAPEIILNLTSLTAEKRLQIEKQLLDYQNQAMRTLALAYVELANNEDVFFEGKLNVQKLNFAGTFAISDPIRPEVPDAIKSCVAAGIQVKIVTGDTTGTAKKIACDIGLWNDSDTDEQLLTGVEFAAMTDEEAMSKIHKMKILSRAKPNDKERLVRLLKARDYVVAATGDGTNDAPALNAANVGLSMGDGTAVAKEASDMTIQDNSFSTIANAVMWGRSLYKNIQRFIMFQMTINVAACLVVLIGAFMGTESPLTVTQMLWVNLIMDTFAAIALASLPPTQKVMQDKPRQVTESIINKDMALNIFGLGGFFTILLLALAYIMQHSDITCMSDFKNFSLGSYDGLNEYELSLFFTIFVMLQFWNMFNAKAFMTNKSAFADIAKCKGFLFIASVIFIGQIFIVELGGKMFNVTHLKLIDWFTIIGFSSFVLIIGEFVRMIRK